MNHRILPLERNPTLGDQAYDTLRSALMTGTFQPGEVLSIRPLATKLGISATPARDAISRLVWEQGFEMLPNRTLKVPKLTLARLQEIYNVRINVEGLATSLATERFDKEALKSLEEVQRRHAAAVDRKDYPRALVANETFHFAIYERAENETLFGIIQALWLKLGPSLNLLYPSYQKDRKGIRHHTRILAALRDRDPVKARAELEADLRDGLQELEGAIRRTRVED